MSDIKTLDCKDKEESLSFVILTMIVVCLVLLFGLAQSIMTFPILSNTISTNSSSDLTSAFQIVSWIGLFIFPVSIIWILTTGIQRCVQINKECKVESK